MAIDASIPLQGTGFSLMDVLRNVQQLKSSDQENRYRQFTMDQARQKSAQDAQDRAQQHILLGAKIIRQVNPTDDASWQQARSIAQQYGVPLDNVPDHFDPNYVKQIVATADALDPQTKNLTDMQRNAEYLKKENPALAQRYLEQQAGGKPQFMTVWDGDRQTIVGVNPDGSVVGGAAPGQPSGGGATALNGNNPGGIIDGPYARSQPGYKGANGRYASFADMSSGEAAQKNLLRSYIARGYDTPAKIAARWAPAGDGNNNPTAYAQNVANMLGIGVNDKLTPADVNRFQQAQGRQENAMYGQQPQPAQQASAHVLWQGAPKPDKSTQDTPTLDQKSIDLVAERYLTDGTMPALGMGKDAARLRAAIIGRAAQLAHERGLDGANFAGNVADYKANSAALTSLNRTAAQVMAFEDTARRNAAIALRAGAKVGNGGIPAFNKWINAGRKETGDPDITAFRAATENFANEYAKVVSGATGGSVTSDSARAHANALINTAMTPQQFIGVVNTIVADMNSRRKGFDDQREALRSQIRGGLKSRSQSGVPSDIAAILQKYQ